MMLDKSKLNLIVSGIQLMSFCFECEGGEGREQSDCAYVGLVRGLSCAWLRLSERLCRYVSTSSESIARDCLLHVRARVRQQIHGDRFDDTKTCKARFLLCSFTMASSTIPKHADDALTESLLNPDVDDQLILEEDWPQELQVVAGEKQPSQYRDVVFAVLFILQLLVVIGFAIFWGFPALRYGPPEDNNTEDVEFSGILIISLLSGLAAFLTSAVALSVMIHYAHLLVPFSTLFSIFSSLMMVIVFGFQDQDGAAFVAFLFFCLSSFWAWAVWSRIPFATSNLVCALTAIRANLGVALVAYVVVIAAVVWTMIWMTSFLGVYAQSVDCNSEGVCFGSVGSWAIVLYLLSFYWTQQVLKNLVHVTVAGVVGTFWFEPSEASSMFSRAILDSAFRSVTYSLGSVCLGSLLTAAVQVCRTLVENARAHGNDGIIMCILDCLLGCLERIVEYFNKFVSLCVYVSLAIMGYVLIAITYSDK